VERAVLRAAFLILVLDAIILLLLYNVMLAGDARFAVLRLTFFLFLFIYLFKPVWHSWLESAGSWTKRPTAASRA
jgi:membrane protease YdiL (CAAX protease family)